MTLSEQQLTFFETFGYLVFPGLFADEADAISDEFERVWAEHGGGHHGRPHDNARRSALLPFIDQNEYLSALLDDPRIDDVASLLLGDDYNYEDSDGNYYVGDTNGTPMATRARSIAISSSPSTWIRSHATQGACA